MYGSVTNPVNLGSGATSQQGGGVIILTVGGALTNNGTIAANGEGLVNEGGTGGGSGGSINITAASIAGNGLITANGGKGEFTNAGGGGGGGRVAIRLTQSGATFASYAVTDISALAGDGGSSQTAEDGAAGTVYLKTVDQAYGDLIVKNFGASTAALTLLADGTYRFDSITTTNYGVLAPGSNGVLELTGCDLISDSTTNSITSRIILGEDNGSVTWPPAYTNTGVLSWKGTNLYAMTTDLTIASAGIVTHDVGGSSEAHKLNLALTGNLTIDSGGAIYVAQRGYTGGNGPGAGNGRGGAGHGGEGGLGHLSGGNRGTTYGSIANPVTYGSSAAYFGRKGGGAIEITVSGALTNNGEISADGESAPPIHDGGGGGAGGSINLTAATLSGNGVITANGGRSDRNAAGGGGGGRIAIRLAQAGATFDTFGTANITASGGALGLPSVCCTEDAGAAGTVYLMSADGIYGDLIVDNGDATGAETLIPTTLTNTMLKDVVLNNLASVNLPTGQSFTVYGNWSNAAPTDAFFGGGSVVFAGAATGTVYGSSVFEIFTATTAGKLLQFEAGTTNTATKEITLQGGAGTNLVLRSTQSGSQWGLNVTAAVAGEKKNFQYLDVMDSDARPGTSIRARDSVNSGNNSNWVFSGSGLTNTWTGLQGTAWSEGGNWSLGGAPELFDAKVVIPTLAPVFPILDGPASINELEMQAGTTLEINNQVLTVLGDATIAGTLIAADAETITFAADLVFTGSGAFTAAQSTLKLGGTEPVTFTPLSNTFCALDIDNSNTVMVTDGFTVGDLTFPSSSATVSFGAGFTANNVTVVVTDGAMLTFTAGQTYTVNNHLQLTGASGNLINLATTGGSWDLDVNGFASVSYVDVTDSDASGGRTIYAAGSTGNGSNPNWNFTLGKVWAGTTDDWGSNSNWTPTGVPGATSHVIIDGSGSAMPRLTNATTIAGLTVVGINAAATLTVDMPFAGPDVLTVNGDAEIRTNATLTHTAGGETYGLALDIDGSLTINEGGEIDVAERGYTGGQGPGVGNGRGAAGHGGEGGKGFQSTIRGTTYGSIANPIRHGSSSSYQNRTGGGLIKITVSGALANNGTISADGESAPFASDQGGGGAGGSINITAATLSGNGGITANGGDGDSNAAGGGGGGRVAVRLTQGGATFDAFPAARITTVGGDGGPNQGAEDGAAGTVYLETQAQGSGGVVMINNKARTTTASTHIRPFTDYTVDELIDATVVLTNTAAVLSTTNMTIGDILIFPNSFWTLTNWTLSVDSPEHSLEDITDPNPGATNRVDDYGHILWIGIPGGMVLEFR